MQKIYLKRKLREKLKKKERDAFDRELTTYALQAKTYIQIIKKQDLR